VNCWISLTTASPSMFCFSSHSYTCHDKEMSHLEQHLNLISYPLKDGYTRICVKEVNVIGIDVQSDITASMR
jgi:hypothetical protein